jgi:hypothetical protein
MRKYFSVYSIAFCALAVSNCAPDSSEKQEISSKSLVHDPDPMISGANEWEGFELTDKQISALETKARLGDANSAVALANHYGALGKPAEDRWLYWTRIGSDLGDSKSTRDLIYFSLANGKCNSAERYKTSLFNKNSKPTINRYELERAILKCRKNPIGAGDWTTQSKDD